MDEQVRCLKQEITNIREDLPSSEAYDEIVAKANEIPEVFISQYNKKICLDNSNEAKYPDSIKEFALTLHMYSAKSYRYICEYFTSVSQMNPL